MQLDQSMQLFCIRKIYLVQQKTNASAISLSHVTFEGIIDLIFSYHIGRTYYTKVYNKLSDTQPEWCKNESFN